jgi:fructose-1,6-bisphosphatase/inositol monophosphatase family enzyme
MPDLMQAVPELLRQAAATVVLPVFGRAEAEPTQKARGEWVTTADRAAEAMLAPALAALVPGSFVIGEEAASADPGLLSFPAPSHDVWLLDPLDGTANFAAGRAPFAMMVALQHRGETVAGWILDPLSGQLAAAERGSGAWLSGSRVRTPAELPALASLIGAASRRFLPQALAAHVVAAESDFAVLTGGTGCAGADYAAIVAGARDFALYWRTLPWDHAPGVLITTEAGGAARRVDGTAYLAADYARPGLLVAANDEVWQQARDRLVPESYR